MDNQTQDSAFFRINAGAAVYRRLSGRWTKWRTEAENTPRRDGWRRGDYYYYRNESDGFVYRVALADAVRSYPATAAAPEAPAPEADPAAEIDRLRHGLEVIRAGIGSEDRVPSSLIKRDIDHLLAGGTLPIMIAAPPVLEEDRSMDNQSELLEDGNPDCEQCRQATAVVCCEDAVWRCDDCCAADGYDSETGERTY